MDSAHKPSKAALAYANFIVRRPAVVLLTLLVLGLLATWASTKLTINSNQLDLISQDLQEVKDVKRVIDMVGGSGHLMLALRSEDEKALKTASDNLAKMLAADKEHVRSITYKVPVEFIQQNMVLFMRTEDLAEARKRITAYVRDQIRRHNPFFIEIKKTEPVKLELQDIIDHYSHIGKKSILDDYYISDDKKMLMILIKPMWDQNELFKTRDWLDQTLIPSLNAYNQDGVRLVEDYSKMGDSKTLYYGFTGSYKLALDDSYAIQQSLEPITYIALISIALITILFFRRWFPTVIVLIGMVLGTVLTMGFTKITIGQLNMITSILGGILMGFGIDYGIHFTFRTRLELGAGKPYDVAIRDALINAGRPALISAIVTAGSFFVLLVSQFRGFSQFGFLAGCGTIIIGFTLFSWCPAILSLLGRRWPDLPKKLIGEMKPPRSHGAQGGEIRIPNPGLTLAICVTIVAGICAFAVPWTDFVLPADRAPTMWERLKGGVHFDYNTRALMPANRPSVLLQDEINKRFSISSDPVAIYSKTLEEAKEIYDELVPNARSGDFRPDQTKYNTVDQVVSVFTFVPPPDVAAANAKILSAWKEDLKDIDISSLPAELKPKAELFMKVLDVKPYTVERLPESYRSQFTELPTSKPENRGWLTFVYPTVDLWDGKRMLQFNDQISVIHTKQGHEYHAAGAAVLYAKLARIVLFDGKLTLILTALWILLMHYADFRSVKLALASVIPLGVGIVLTLGMMSITNHRLNFMNIIILPILLGFGVSHGLYLLHRFLEGVSPVVALRSVGAAVASSTLTAIAGFGSLFAASHNGLKSMGFVACLGLFNTLVVSFTVLAAVLQLIHDGRIKAKESEGAPHPEPTSPTGEHA